MLNDEGKKISPNYEVHSIEQSIINLTNKDNDKYSQWYTLVDSLNWAQFNSLNAAYRTYTYSAPEAGVVGSAMINRVF